MPRGKEPMEEEHCLNNWDLDAVVRFACRRRLSQPPQHDPFASLPPPPTVAPAPEAVKEQEADAGWCFPDLCAGEASGFGRDADELLKAFCTAPPPLPLPPPLPTPPPQQEQRQLQPVMTPADVPLQTASPASAPERAQPSRRQVSGGVPRSKKRKNQQKKVVCHVPADGVSADVWAWRKYGQKPIKGSPYPRGYYRCSSSKGCVARKQVERSRADPNTFILTYTGEHNHAAPTHRNTLAGTTRHKFPSPASSAPQPPPPSVVVTAEAQHLSPPSTSAGLSPTTPLRTPSMEEEEEDELLVEDMDIAGKDDLLFLNGDSDAAALVDGSSSTPMSSLFDVVDEPFLGSPWASATAGEAAAGAAGAGS